MANKNPSPRTRIKKGEVRNPLGARAHNKTLRKVRALSKKELAKIGQLILTKDEAALEKLAQGGKGVPYFKVWVARLAHSASFSKDRAGIFDMLMNRFIGKVKDEVEVKQLDKYDNLSTDELNREIENMEAALKLSKNK